MDRRSFLKTGTLAAGAAASQVAVAKPLKKGKATLAPGRSIFPINRDWRYRNTTTEEAHQPGFDDSSFAKVTLPHTNVPLPWHSFDDRAFEFISLYRRMVRVPAEAEGKRVFVDFEGAMLASTFWINGKRIGEYRGGYTPFSFEITDHLDPSGNNLIAVDVDSTERKDIPPFGHEVDYLTFGGIYRGVALRVVPKIFIENFHAITKNVLSPSPTVDVNVYLDRPEGVVPGTLAVKAELRDGEKVISRTSAGVKLPAATVHYWADADQKLGSRAYDAAVDAPSATVTLSGLGGGKIELWDVKRPKLYTVVVQLLENGTVIDEETRRIGFREAVFTPEGFSLNGKVIKLHGLDRHQTFPWVGQAMPARAQRQDAKILRYDLRCNIVRTSHYPQSRHFLDACDEFGLLVLEEIPGWQHIGNVPWQDVSVDNVRRMVRRDWNHPSIILWGTRINESKDSHDFYTRTNALSKALDPTRQTCGVRAGNFESELIEDVMTMNDFGWPLRAPNHPLWLNTEFVGHTFPTKTIDAYERQRDHVIRHARVHDTLASAPQYSGGLGWCAFDYATHANFGSGDRICYHGVMDIFRTPKPAALFYKSMADRDEEIVLEPGFYWARNDESIGITTALFLSNVDHIKLYTISANGETFAGEGGPDRAQFSHLKYPPFFIKLIGEAIRVDSWGDLRIDGYIDGKLAISKKVSGSGADHEFHLLPDETTLVADGADSVRVVLKTTDQYGALRHFASDAIELSLDGPADLIGDNPFGLIGGTGAVWIRAQHVPGTVTLKAKHPYLGVTSITLTLTPSEPEKA